MHDQIFDYVFYVQFEVNKMLLVNVVCIVHARARASGPQLRPFANRPTHFCQRPSSACSCLEVNGATLKIRSHLICDIVTLRRWQKWLDSSPCPLHCMSEGVQDVGAG
jgi:hypothetical protein